MPPLRYLLPTLAGLLLLGHPLLAQISRDKIYSRPEIPSKEVLARLNLHLRWANYVPTDGQRDRIVHVELNGPDLIALTRSGIVQLMDAEKGIVKWRTTVGKAYTLLPFVAANNRSIYVIANAKMVSLERATGKQQWEYDLPAGVSAAPIVDGEQIYVPTATTRLYTYYLPFTRDDVSDSPGETTRRATIDGEGEERGPRPLLTWSEQTNIQLSFKPLQAADSLFLLSSSGKGYGYGKIVREGQSTVAELYPIAIEGKIRAQPGSYGDTAFVGSDDASLYAINITTGRLRWRHTAGTAITRSPAATDKDVFVTSEREGLARIDRVTGDPRWLIPSGRAFAHANPLADRFLAANDRFVYATDASGRLLVLDYKRGIRLSLLDTRNFRVPIVNELTDRLYLAANDGLIVCLHDRDLVNPMRHRKGLEDADSPIFKALDAKINEPGGTELSLREVLDNLRKKYNVKIRLALVAFKNEKLDDPSEKKVKPPRTEDKPLRDHLQRLLKPLGATFEVVDQEILIIPGKGKG